MQRKKAAVLELDGTHEECLYSQLLFLREGGYDTALLFEEALGKKLGGIRAGNREVPWKLKDKKGLAYWRALWEVRNFLISHEYEILIFNSPQGSLTRDFSLLPFPRHFQWYGTLHGINKLRGSFTQKMINRKIKNYFVLNDYLVDNLDRVPHAGLRIQSYYSIFFPEYPDAPFIEKPENVLWIGIPGQVEYKRRDYETLVRAFAALKEKPAYRFLILGDDQHTHSNGKELKALIQESGVADYFLFTGYLSYPDYHAWIKKCDIIAPLIHPGNESYEKYLIYQITGGYNLAFAYKKPLLMLQDFDKYEDFRENAVFYTLGQLSESLEKLPQSIAALRPGMYRQPKWTFEYQCRQYLDFISRDY